MAVVQLDIAKSREIVELAITQLRQKDNENALKDILAECDKETEPMRQFQLKMSKLIPKVMEILGTQIQTVLGSPVEASQVMGYVMQIQALAMNDLHLGIQVGKVMKTLSGDFSGLYEEDAEEEAELIE